MMVIKVKYVLQKTGDVGSDRDGNMMINDARKDADNTEIS
jgi:hypothetical protein